MKVQLSAQNRARHQSRYRVTYEPDYEHDAWYGDAAPTPQSHPDAFCLHRELVNPGPTKVTVRKAPHETLSLGALKKRLSRAGIRGRRVAEIAREIHAGPGLDALTVGCVTVMGWPLKALESRYGKRVARAVARFVRTNLIVQDEAWSLLASEGTADMVLRSSRSMRKYSGKPLLVSQASPAVIAQS